MKNSKAIWTVKTECGPIREKNEDAIYPEKSGSSGLPIKAGIFDGMGGHKKGEVASLLASKVMNANFINISDYVNLANKNILDYQNKHTEAMRLATSPFLWPPIPSNIPAFIGKLEEPDLSGYIASSFFSLIGPHSVFTVHIALLFFI